MNRSHAVMTVLFIVLGVALGARMLEGEGGFIFGGLVGFLLADVIELRRRLARSGRQPTEGRATPDAVAPTPPFEPAREKPPAPAPAAAAPDLVVPSPRSEPPVPTAASPIEPEPAHSLESPTARPSAPSDAEVVRVAPLAHQGPSFDGGGIRLIRTWVTTGNVPVKIGVLLSLIGLGFLLGVALDQGWITLSIEVRHVLVAMFGVFLLAVGWRVRCRNPIYGLSLQGGGIAVLYLTTYVAHAVYDLLPASASAAAVVMITVGAGALAVLEDARSLAVLGIIGGFLAPILAYSDARDHVLVFGFYLILSAAVVAVARFKTWPELNLLGLGFTLGVSAFWILNRYSEQDWATTQPLIALLVLLYMTIPVLFAARQPPDLKAWMTSPLVFGLPFAALGLQLVLTGHFEYGAAVSSGVLAAIQALLASMAHRYGKESGSLRDAYAGLSVAFVAITVPLALEAQFISVAWALQGGVLVWFGVRHQRRLATLAGSLLQALAGLAFLGYLIASDFDAGELTPVLNGYFLGAALLAVVGLLSGRSLDLGGEDRDDTRALCWLALVWSTGWWILGGLLETMLHVAPDARLTVSIVFVTVSLGGLALAAPLIGWMRLRTVGVALLPALALFLALALILQSHPFGMHGWAGWIVAMASFYSVLRWREGAFRWAIPAMHTVGYWVLVILLGREIYWQVDQVASDIWPITAALATVLAVVIGTLVARRAMTWPLRTHWRTYLMACAGPALLVVAVMALATNLTSDGASPPLTYVPLFNPLEILTALVAVVALMWKRLADRQADHPLEDLVGRSWIPGLTVVGIILLTMVVARAVHHWLDVPFDFDAMIDSTVLHASLSIVWGIAGLSGMVAGVRLVRRAVWIGGASLMGVVVVKLFLFDLANTGTVARVVSFLGVGLLLIVVGYFAPVPPSTSGQAEATEGRGEPEGSDRETSGD
ncbi:MAG: DUF2339 domain-containing protein [bacterium]|nr:DUF2339 domain-containing protein [bacterium]